MRVLLMIAFALVLGVVTSTASGPESFPKSTPAPQASSNPTHDASEKPVVESPSRAVAAIPLRARGPKGDHSSETWDFALAFQNGERLLVRFLLTNIGPGDGNAAAIWHWIDATGQIAEYDNGQSKGGWSLEDGARIVRIKSSVLDLRRPNLRLTMTKGRARIDLSLQLPPTALHDAQGGNDRFELWATHAPVRGSYWTRAMSDPRPVEGTGSFVYTYVRDGRREVRRVEFVSFDPSAALYANATLLEDGSQHNWAYLGAADGSGRVTRDVVLCPATQDAYAWPKRLMLDGADIHVSPPFLRYDPLSALPKAIGALVSWVLEPMRLWSQASAGIDGRSVPGALRTTFGNPLKKSVRKQLGGNARCAEGDAS